MTKYYLSEDSKNRIQTLFDYLKPPHITYRQHSPSYNDYDWDILSSKELDEQRSGHCVDKANYCYTMAEKFGLPKPRLYYSLSILEHGSINHAFVVFFDTVLVETADEGRLGVYYCNDVKECLELETLHDQPDNKLLETVFIEYFPEDKHYGSTVDFFNSLLEKERPELLMNKPERDKL